MIFSAENLMTLLMLIMLQAVLGFDNLLYITLESKRAPEPQQKRVRVVGIGIAVVLRIALLFALMTLKQYVQDPVVNYTFGKYLSFNMSIHSIIVLVGGAFILYTATKEVMHMMSLHDIELDDRKSQSAGKVIFLIVAMNVIFSVDSILSAMALSDVFWVMATAIVISGILMIWLADTVAAFLQKNRMYEVLGLFVLFVVGIMLLTEGGHLGHIKILGNEIVPMSKTTFYFIIAVLVATDVVQTRYQKRINRLRELETQAKRAE